MSKIGVHVIIGSRRGYGDFLRKIAAAGQRLAVVKCVDDFGPAAEAKALMPNTLTLGRLNTAIGMDDKSFDTQAYEPLKPDGTYVDAREIAERYYAAVKPKWKLNPQIDVWETFNEFSAHWGWQSDFYLAMMDLAEADGFKLAHYACSTGNPPDAATVQMLPCLKAAKQRGHYLTLHEYGGVGTDVVTLKGTQPFHALRYRQLYETVLIPNQADPPLIISETGQHGGAVFPGTETFIDDFTWYDAELMKDSYVVGAAAWTLGRTPQWSGANFQDALPALADYIVATPTPTPPPPRGPLEQPLVYQAVATDVTPVTSRPRGAPRTQYARTYLLLPNEPPTPEGNARLEQWIGAVVASGVLTKYRWTLGASADDAGIGDLDQRTIIAINPDTWPTSLADFYATEYPNVNYQSIQAATPDELRTRLMNFVPG
jgi:hypothetical protein